MCTYDRPILGEIYGTLPPPNLFGSEGCHCVRNTTSLLRVTSVRFGTRHAPPITPHNHCCIPPYSRTDKIRRCLHLRVVRPAWSRFVRGHSPNGRRASVKMVTEPSYPRPVAAVSGTSNGCTLSVICLLAPVADCLPKKKARKMHMQ